MGQYTHLWSSDRRRFYTFLEMKLPIAEIAKKLTKHRSTLYRELERNKEPEGYLPGVAQLKTDERVALTAEKLNKALAELKQNLISKNEATDIFGVERTRDSIAGIIGNVMQSFGGEELYPSIEEKAANLLYFIIKNH